MGVGLPSAIACSGSAWRAVRQRAEQGFVEQFIAQAFDERLDKGILDRLAGRCSASCDRRPIARWRSRSARCRCRSRSSWVVHSSEEPIELASDPDAEDRGVGHQREASARERGVANRRSNPEPEASPAFDNVIVIRLKTLGLALRNRTPGWSPFVNSTPASSRARLSAATVEP